jgi:hypothetical protein
MTTPGTIQLNIERLVLDGLDIPPGQRHLLQAGIEVELARMLRQGGVVSPLGGGAYDRISAADVMFAPGNDPQPLGHQIARSVFGSLVRTTPVFAPAAPAKSPGRDHSR